MRRANAKFVPRQLTTDQKECRMMVTGDLFEKSTQDPTFLTKIVTGDESWVFAYDPETKMHSAEWHTSSSPRPKKSRLVKSKEKVMLTAFFDVQVLQRLRDKWQGEWFLHHDNAPSSTSLVVLQLLAEKSIPVITQPPYSPDLAPSDFWLFPTLKMGLKGTRFATTEDIKSNATAELRRIPKETFHRCFQQRQDRWSKCVCVRKGHTLKVIR